MNTEPKIPPYDPIPPELASSGKLVPIKQAAEKFDCCAGTLRANAKSRRLRAFQHHHGAPVLVLPAIVEAFLKSRPDIASVFPTQEPDISPATGEVEKIPATPGEPAFPDEDGPPLAAGDSTPEADAGIPLRALLGASPSERALVAACLSEIATRIKPAMPDPSGHD